MIRPLRHLLRLLGRHAPLAYAASLVVGLCLPWLAAGVRPLLPVTIVCMIGLTFARANLANVGAGLRRPLRVLAALAFSTLAMPLLMALLILVLGRGALDVGVLMGFALIAAAPPLQSAPIYAALLGFDNSLVLTVLVAGMALVPVTAPPLASFITGADLPIDPAILSWRLVALLATAAIIALSLRRFVGQGRMMRWRVEFDGLNVVFFFIFAVAAMDGVLPLTLADPLRSLIYLAICFAVSAAGFLVALFVMRWLGRHDAFTLALGIGFRNTGLLVAPLGAAIPKEGYLFFSLLQFPIYLVPLLLGPLARLIMRQTQGTVPDSPVAPRKRG